MANETNVRFKQGPQESYNLAKANGTLLANALYFTTDTHRLFLGENEISTPIRVTGLDYEGSVNFPSGYNDDSFATITDELKTGEVRLGSAATQNVLTLFGPGQYYIKEEFGNRYVPTAYAVNELVQSRGWLRFGGDEGKYWNPNESNFLDLIENWKNSRQKGTIYRWVGPDQTIPKRYVGNPGYAEEAAADVALCKNYFFLLNEEPYAVLDENDEIVKDENDSIVYEYKNKIIVIPTTSEEEVVNIVENSLNNLLHKVTDWNDEVNNAWVYEDGRASDGSAFTNGSNNKPNSVGPETILVGTVRRVDLTNGGCIIRQEAWGINRHENAKYIRFGKDIAGEGTITWQDWNFITNEDEITYCKPAGTYTFGASVMDLTPSFGYSKIFVIQMEQPFTAANGIGVNTGSYISYIYNAKSEKITYLPAGNWVIAHCSNDNGTVNFCLLNEPQNTMVGTSSDGNTPGKSGLVPRPSYGDNTRFLRGDGVWAQPTLIPYGTASTMETTVYYDNEAYNVSQITVNATENMLGYQYCTITFPQDYTLEEGNEKIIFLISTSNINVPLIPQYKGNPLKIVPKGTYQWVKVDGNQTYELIGTYGPEWEELNNG